MGQVTLRYRALAIADLQRIALYTHETHGEEQAALYMTRLREALEKLASFPRLGRAAAVPGYRVLTVAEHVVFYRLDGDTVWIVRVLHQRRHPPRKLQG